MPSKSPELKAIEKKIKEEQKHTQEAARRDRAKSVVNASKSIGNFRVMCLEAETVLKIALESNTDQNKYEVSVIKNVFSQNISDNFALICEELQLYGMITAYRLVGNFAILTLSEAGKRYFKDKEETEMKVANISGAERNEIFISHRTVDAPVAEMIKDFLVNTGISNENVFCSSLPGNDVKEKISPEVKERLRKCSIIILILSKDYYDSPYCLNEAGIAWYLSEVVSIPVGMPEISHNNMIGFLNSDYKLRRLDNDGDISYLYDTAQERLQTENIRHSVITQETKKLKEKYSDYLSKRKEPNSEVGNSQNAIKNVPIDIDEGILLVYAAECKGEILVSGSISRSGPSVEAGGYDFAEDDTPRECARWKAVVEKLEQHGLIECPKYDGKYYKVTELGFTVSDQVKEKWRIDVSKPPKENL